MLKEVKKETSPVYETLEACIDKKSLHELQLDIEMNKTEITDEEKKVIFLAVSISFAIFFLCVYISTGAFSFLLCYNLISILVIIILIILGKIIPSSKDTMDGIIIILIFYMIICIIMFLFPCENCSEYGIFD